MTASKRVIPVVLFCYNRPKYLAQTLKCLRRNSVPLMYCFSDGPKTLDDVAKVGEVRSLLNEIDWCQTEIIARIENMGLGTSIRSGVTEVLEKHESAIVFEDDLVCVHGTYNFLCAALKYYADDPKVMSVTGWTHPLVVPPDVRELPYFDCRSESWVWGTWRRAWGGMEKDLDTIIRECVIKNIDLNKSGHDLLSYVPLESSGNLWAVRFCYLHLLYEGLCLRPPWSMVKHIGYGSDGTNVKVDDPGKWRDPPLKACPPIPVQWPEPVENEACTVLWKKHLPRKNYFHRVIYNLFLRFKSFLKSVFCLSSKMT